MNESMWKRDVLKNTTLPDITYYSEITEQVRQEVDEVCFDIEDSENGKRIFVSCFGTPETLGYLSNTIQ